MTQKKGFQTVYGKWNTDSASSGIFVNYLNKADFEKVFNKDLINGYKFIEYNENFEINLK